MLLIVDQYLLFIQNLFSISWYNVTASLLTNVVVQYSHRSNHTPDNKVGIKEWAGFIDAPDMKAKTSMWKFK